MKRKLLTLALINASFFLGSNAHASCGSAFCTLNTNWNTQGIWTQAGARLDLRYEYVNQDELRSGTHNAKADDIAELDHYEKNTFNQNLQASIDYAFNETYGLTINAPIVARKHTHIHQNPDDPTDSEKEMWDFTRIGDTRITGRMQLSPTADIYTNYGTLLGIKLPTGDYTVANDDEVAERSLQPGTGTTDAILGAYIHHKLPTLNSQWFAQFLSTQALNQRAEFKAGAQWGMDFGITYKRSDTLNVMAQLNFLNKGRDTGDAAEPDESGSKTLSLSPGISIALTHETQVYGFLHHRLYQNVNGVQLSSKDSFVVGVSTHF